MERSDFSVPRRMSKSAFIILLVKELLSYAGPFLIWAIIKLFNSGRQRSLMETMEMLLFLFICYLVFSVVTAFISYYYKKYYIKNGNLIFIYGFLKKETVIPLQKIQSLRTRRGFMYHIKNGNLIFIYGFLKKETVIPLQKIQSLRTRRGFMYRLLDMKGVSFDTLASKAAEVELILDYKDWDALIERIEQQEQMPEEDKQPTEENCVIREAKPVANKYTLKLSNLNLIKGAFCQNHFRGMIVLLGILFTFYDKVLSASDRILNLFIDYVNEHADYASLSVTVFVICIIVLYLVIMILWIVNVFMQYFNMEVQIDKAQLSFESGLFTRFSSRFSYDKVCTVYVKQNIIEKYLGCCTIMLKQAFNATQKDNESDVKIYGSNTSEHFLNWWLGKDYVSSQSIISAKSGKGVIGYTVRFDIPVSLIVCIVLYYYELYSWLAVPVVYMLISLVKGILAAYRSSITLKEDYLEINNGKLADVRNYIKYTNVEFVSLKQTPFTPFFHRVNLIISTNGTSFKVRSLKEAEARDVYELLINNSVEQEKGNGNLK